MKEKAIIDQGPHDISNKALYSNEYEAVHNTYEEIKHSFRELFPDLPEEIQRYLFYKHHISNPITHDDEKNRKWIEEKKDYTPTEDFPGNWEIELPSTYCYLETQYMDIEEIKEFFGKKCFI
jgi:hypothetical protein